MKKNNFTGLLIRDCGLDSLEITGYVYQGTYIVLHKEDVNLNNVLRKVRKGELHVVLKQQIHFSFIACKLFGMYWT